jgi:hypothetical protein
VSDQSVLLAGGLENEYSIKPAFVVLNSRESSGVSWPVVHCSPSQLLECCLQLTGGLPGAMLVHLSGYGYSRDGAPTLLAEALAGVRASGSFRTAVYFHELFATGLPWRKAFWFSRRQQRAVKRIAEGADLLVTSTRHHAGWLESIATRRSKIAVQSLPVISAAGEAQQPAPLADREPVLAVFGLPGSRIRAYKELSASGAMLQTLAIREIFDIGAEFDAPAAQNGIPVKRMGVQPAENLATLFSRVQFGFVPHAPNSLAKSSIFASFSSQGTIPVLAKSFFGEVDGLQDGVHAISPATAAAVRQSGFANCSRAVWEWYTAHRLRVHTEFYAKWLEDVEPQDPAQPRAAPGLTGASNV